MKDIDVYDIILEPGDVLFVPKHWWHFVTSLDSITISVNSWLEQVKHTIDLKRIRMIILA